MQEVLEEMHVLCLGCYTQDAGRGLRLLKCVISAIKVDRDMIYILNLYDSSRPERYSSSGIFQNSWQPSHA